MAAQVLEAHVRDTDVFTWRMERDPLLRSTIVAVSVFDRSPDWDVLCDRVERATRLTPTFRQRLAPSSLPFGLSSPRWLFDADFDLAWHLRRVGAPAPGTLDAVLELARVIGMAAFDPARPMWEFTLVEDLADGRAALVMKVHHALTDGIGGIQLAAHVVDLERTTADLGPMPPVPTAPHHDQVDLVREALGHELRRVVDAVVGGVSGLPATAASAVRHPVGTVSSALATARSVARFVAPVTATLSPVMVERRLAWRYGVLDLSFEALHDAARAVDGTVNDAFVAGVTGGLRRYHERHHAAVDELHMSMPISVRAADDLAAGNRVTLMRFVVPVGEADPAARMRQVDELCVGLRVEPSIPYSNTVAAVLNLLPAAVTGGMLKHVDVLASNVPGFPDAVYVGGAKVEAFYPLGPTIGSSANITLMSYDGRCCIGVNTDDGAVPDPEDFLECLRQGFDEVAAVAGDHDPARIVAASWRG